LSVGWGGGWSGWVEGAKRGGWVEGRWWEVDGRWSEAVAK